MPKNKNAEHRFLILDRCLSDFSHKYSIDDLLDKVNDQLYDSYGSKSMIMTRQLRGDLNTMRKMLPDGVYIEAIPFEGKPRYLLNISMVERRFCTSATDNSFL